MQILKSITLENFRVFRTSHQIELKPLTVLIGPNSSGKSSVIKSLILCSNNSSNKLQTLDFTGPKHNLGTFINATNNNSNNPFIKIGFEFELTKESYQHDRYLFRNETILQRYDGNTSRGSYKRLGALLRNVPAAKKLTSLINVVFTYFPNQGSGELSQIEYFADNRENPFIKFLLNDSESENHKLVIDFEQINKNELLRKTFLEPIESLSQFSKNKSDETKRVKELRNIYKLNGIQVFRVEKEEDTSINHKNTSEICKNLILELIKSFGLLDSEHRFNVLVAKSLTGLIPDYLSLLVENTDFVEAIRANTRRIYTNDSQGTSFNDLILDFRSRKRTKESLEFINFWLKRFDIADEIFFEQVEGVATSIFLEKKNKKIALADLGFGATQILPLIMKISMESLRVDGRIPIPIDKIIMLEEPETNLHPKLQSLLADFLFDATQKFAVQFVIETHSEYLVRKLQIMVAEQTLKKDDVKIYYFNSEEDDEGKVTKEINILENGSLSDDFGNGFWDEATRLQIELMKLKRDKNE